MTYFSNVFPTLNQTLQDRSWPWIDVAKGHLDGIKAVNALKPEHRTTILKWVGSVADSYKCYSQLTSMDFFRRYPGFVKPLQAATLGVCAFNFIHICSSDPRQFKGLWNLTPKIHAITNLVTTALEFPQKPMKAVSYFASVGVAVIGKLYEDGWIAFSLRFSPWIARGNVMWNGSWGERSVIVLKGLMWVGKNVR